MWHRGGLIAGVTLASPESYFMLCNWTLASSMSRFR